MGKLNNKQKSSEEPLKPSDEAEPVAPEEHADAVAAEAADTEPAKEQPTTDAPSTSQTPRRGGIKQLLRSKQFRIAAPLVVVLLVALVAFVEPVKFAALNLVTSGSAEFVVVDDTTLVPLEKAIVTVGAQRGQTDKNGKATLKKLHFGKVSYTIQKATYTIVTGTAKIKPGSNLIGPVKAHSDGVPLRVTAVNGLSKEAVKRFKIALEGTEISALSDDKGTAVLKVPSNKLGEVTVVVSADNFNSTKQKVMVAAAGVPAQTISIAPAGRHYFLSNRSGKIGVFASNLDGTGQVEVIPGTGAEDSTSQLLIAPDGKHAALVSKRDKQKGPNGQTLPALFAIDLVQKTVKRIDEGAPTFGLIGWQNDNQILYSVSYDDYNRADNSKLKRADVGSGKLETLYTQKGYLTFYLYEEDKGHVYFMNYDQSVELYGLISVDLKTGAKKRLYNYPGGDVRHVKPYQLVFQYENKWYEVDMKAQQVKDGQQPSGNNTVLSVSPSMQKMAWVETRDGKGAIITAAADGSDQKQVTKGVNVGGIIRWVTDDYMVYVVATSDESAHYIVHLPTGTVTKISDVYRVDKYSF